MAIRRIGQILVDLGFITDEQLEQLLEEQQQRPGKLFGKLAEELELITDEQLAQALAEQWNMQVISLGDTVIPPQVLSLRHRADGPDVPDRSGQLPRQHADRGHVRSAEPGGPGRAAHLPGLRNPLGRGHRARDQGRARSLLLGQRRERRKRSWPTWRATRNWPGRGRGGQQGRPDRPDERRGPGRQRSGSQAAEHGACCWPSRTMPATCTSSRSKTSSASASRPTACCTKWCRRRAIWPLPSPPASRSWPTWTSPSGACRRTAASS